MGWVEYSKLLDGLIMTASSAFVSFKISELSLDK